MLPCPALAHPLSPSVDNALLAWSTCHSSRDSAPRHQQPCAHRERRRDAHAIARGHSRPTVVIGAGRQPRSTRCAEKNMTSGLSIALSLFTEALPWWWCAALAFCQVCQPPLSLWYRCCATCDGETASPSFTRDLPARPSSTPSKKKKGRRGDHQVVPARPAGRH